MKPLVGSKGTHDWSMNTSTQTNGSALVFCLISKPVTSRAGMPMLRASATIVRARPSGEALVSDWLRICAGSSVAPVGMSAQKRKIHCTRSETVWPSSCAFWATLRTISLSAGMFASPLR